MVSTRFIASAFCLATVALAIAPNYRDACNCPKNCKHKEGSSCKYYYDDITGKQHTLKGTCNTQNEELICL
ncbi:hypothetical protein F4778DRAFT_717246 [Xylariomycetidae sp. FL2044]|nr:hypothetical protein F4778DRAFT_717246 [Xylariomycetidae sp. FL2044]